jgi:hypothetical protein
VVLCLGAAKTLAPPGGALRPGLVPAGWGALGRCLLARFGGGNGPAAGALIGLNALAASIWPRIARNRELTCFLGAPLARGRAITTTTTHNQDQGPLFACAST